MYEVDEQPPSAQVKRMMDGVLIARLVQVAVELGVPDLVSARPRPVEEIANRTGAEPDALYRALRTLASVGVFSEQPARTFGLTPLAEVLCAGASDSVRDIVRMQGGREFWRTWTELQHSILTGQPAFDYVNGTDRWSYLASHQDESALFDKVMGSRTRQVHAAAVSAYDLSDSRRLIDVGGGHGYLVARLLQRYPDMTAVVFDQEHTAPGAERVLTEGGVRDRAEVTAGDFFEFVPSGGDTYVLSRILHDWDDVTAKAILENVRRAMPPGARLLVVEAVVPEGDAAHPAQITDIIMLAVHGSRERTEGEFTRLFESAGLRHAGTWHTSSPFSLIAAAATAAPTSPHATP